MNTHVKLELPPLPEWVDWPVTVSEMSASEIKEAMQAYARSAIEADRKRRGDPVCTCKTHALGVVHRTDGPCFHYESKPAEPVKNEDEGR